MADASAAVVGDPVNWAGGGVGNDFLESLEDGEADSAFVEGGSFRVEAYAIAWQFWYKERGMRFPRFQDLIVGLALSRLSCRLCPCCNA